MPVRTSSHYRGCIGFEPKKNVSPGNWAGYQVYIGSRTYCLEAVAMYLQ
jgi:hypothetical protein